MYVCNDSTAFLSISANRFKCRALSGQLRSIGSFILPLSLRCRKDYSPLNLGFGKGKQPVQTHKMSLCWSKELNLGGSVSGVVMGSFWCEVFVVVNTVLLGGARCGVLGVQRVSAAPCAPLEAV